VVDEEDARKRESGLRIDFTLSIGYKRYRPEAGVEDKWEAHVGTVGLLITGSIVAIAIIIIVVPRILAWITSL